MALGYASLFVIVSTIIYGLNSKWSDLYWAIFSAYIAFGIIRFLKGYSRELGSQKNLSIAVPRAAFYALLWPALVLMIGW